MIEELLPMDGRWIAIVDYPELADIMLGNESRWLAFVNETEARRLQWDPDVSDRDLEWVRTRVKELRAHHKNIRSEDGLKVRLPKKAPSEPQFSGWDKKGREIWAHYQYFIQARPTQTEMLHSINCITVTIKLEETRDPKPKPRASDSALLAAINKL